MKQFRSYHLDGIDSLKLEEVDNLGAIGPGQIRIAMKAASINYRDTMTLSGQLGAVGPQGLIPCSDGAGQVVEVAADVYRVKVGDRVALTFNPDWVGGPWRGSAAAMGRGSIMVSGVMSEQLVVNQVEVVKLPDSLTYAEAATLPCAGVTAWNAICGPETLYPGMSVLLEGAGGVSVLGLQLAKLFGAKVIMTTSSEDRAEKLKALGADTVINYRDNPDWDEAVRAATDGLGVDVGVDIGGAGTIDKTFSATRSGGRVALVGLLSGWPEKTSKLFSAGVSVNGIKVGSRDDFERMLRAMDYHAMKPVIDRSFDFEELPEALRYLESGKHFGKVVIDF